VKQETKSEPSEDAPQVEQAVSKPDPEELRKRFEQQELFIKRRNSEIGELRKQLKAAQEEVTDFAR